jgi:hypothetical protein
MGFGDDIKEFEQDATGQGGQDGDNNANNANGSNDKTEDTMVDSGSYTVSILFPSSHKIIHETTCLPGSALLMELQLTQGHC